MVDGNLDYQTGIYRDAEDGPCDACMSFDESWRERVIDENVVYNSQFKFIWADDKKNLIFWLMFVIFTYLRFKFMAIALWISE